MHSDPASHSGSAFHLGPIFQYLHSIMSKRSLHSLALVLIGLLMVACGGGNQGAVKLGTSSCASTGVNKNFCLVSCSLGCSAGGCSITDIAQNQTLLLNFSQALDPASVNAGTVSIKTASGEAPFGRLLVSGSTIAFVPDLRISGGQTSFGFRPGETYFLSVPDGNTSQQALRSQSGDLLSASVNCSMIVSRGIVDLNGKAPTATLISPDPSDPANLKNVPADQVIILKFDEILDILPFQGADSRTSPIEYLLRRARFDINGEPECDTNFEPLVLDGSPVAAIDPIAETTTVTFVPAAPLPSQVCVEIGVTGGVTDLAGVPALRQVFRFTTEIVAVGIGEISEDFLSDSQQDTQISSGNWSGGQALEPIMGGDGRHGSFSAVNGGLKLPGDIFIWDTDNAIILLPLYAEETFTVDGFPGDNLAEQQLGAKPSYTVTDGQYYFSDFTLRANQTLVFTGTHPPVIHVRGKVQIEGKIQVNAPPSMHFLGSINLLNYQPAGQEAPDSILGGGRGGSGGDPVTVDDALKGVPRPAHNGRDGEDVQLAQGHAYATQALGTGGKGSPMHPTKVSLDVAIKTPPTARDFKDFKLLNGSFNGNVAAGGGGGGFASPGLPGMALTHSPDIKADNDPVPLGPPSVGGISFAPDPKPISSPLTSLDHFMIGGSGGGGAGTHPFLTRFQDPSQTIQRPKPLTTPIWVPGGAGSNGGGALGFRVGGDFGMGLNASLEARGADGWWFDGVQNDTDLVEVPDPNSTGTILQPVDQLFNMPAPGGGGSGGSIVLQVLGEANISGTLDSSGGKGGVTDNKNIMLPAQVRLQSVSMGGDGSPGFLRLEQLVMPQPLDLGPSIPAAASENVGLLEDTEPGNAVVQSKFYSTRLVFPPLFLRYEIQAEVDGQSVLFSDDPNVSPNLADANADLRFQVQGARVNSSNEPDLTSLGAWGDLVSNKVGGSGNLNQSKPTGFRFRLTVDRSSGRKVVVKQVKVVFDPNG